MREGLTAVALDGFDEDGRHRQTSQVVTLSLLGLIALLVGALPFIALLGLVVTRWAPLDSLDQSVAQGLNDVLSSKPIHVRVLEIASELGGGATASFAFTVAAVWLVLRREPRRALYLASTGLGLAVLVPVSKALVGRPRPDVLLPVVDIPTNPSFPSGHAMSSLVTWGALTLVALPMVRRRSQWLMVLTTGAVVMVVGFTRLALGVHFVTDVVAGWALGATWLGITYAAFHRWLRRPRLSSRIASGWNSSAGMLLTPVNEPAMPAGARSAWCVAGSAAVITAVITALGLLITGPLIDTSLLRWDVATVEHVAVLRSAEASTALHALGKLGGLWGVVAVAIATCAIGHAYRGSWRPVLFTVLAVLGEVAIYGATSHMVARRRPDVPDLTSGLPTSASFPSGHVAAATAVYGAMCILVISYARSRRRWVIVVPAAAIVAAMMFARVYVAAHHPTDVVAGALLGVLWLTALHRLLLHPSDPGLTWMSASSRASPA